MSILQDPWKLCDALSFRGGRINFSRIHFELMDELCNAQLEDYAYSSKFVKLSRGHLKSTVLILYTLWRIYRNPNIRILYCTDTKELSRSFIRELRQYFESVDLQEKVWNVREHIEGRLVPALDAGSRRRRTMSREYDTEAEDKKIIWSREAIQVNRSRKMKEPTLVASSVLTTSTGEHYDLVVCDDIVNFTNSDNEDKAEKIYNWVMDLISVLDPPTYDPVCAGFGEYIGNSMYVTGTPYFPWDYYSHIEKNFSALQFNLFSANIYVNGEDSTEGYTYPEKFNDAYVESLMSRMTRRVFSAQYLLNHVNEDDIILEEDLINIIHPATVHYDGIGYATVMVGGMKKTIRLHLIVDPHSGKTSRYVDNTAIAVGGQDDEMNLYVLDLKASRYTTSDAVKMIYDLCAKYGLHMCNVLIKGVGELLPHAINRERLTYNRNIIVKPMNERGDKKTRITNALQPIVKLGKLYVVSWITLHTPLLKEMREHPQSKRDDCLDAITGLATVSKPTRQSYGDSIKCTHLVVNKKYGGSH